MKINAGYFPMGAVIVNKEFSDKFVEVSEEAEDYIKELGSYKMQAKN